MQEEIWSGNSLNVVILPQDSKIGAPTHQKQEERNRKRKWVTIHTHTKTNDYKIEIKDLFGEIDVTYCQ